MGSTTGSTFGGRRQKRNPIGPTGNASTYTEPEDQDDNYEKLIADIRNYIKLYPHHVLKIINDITKAD